MFEKDQANRKQGGTPNQVFCWGTGPASGTTVGLVRAAPPFTTTDHRQTWSPWSRVTKDNVVFGEVPGSYSKSTDTWQQWRGAAEPRDYQPDLASLGWEVVV